MDFINKQTEILVVINTFSLGIYATKVVKGVRLSQCYNAIVGGVHTNFFVFVDGMTNIDLHCSIELMRSEDNKSDCTYEMKISVLSIQSVQVGKSP